MASRHAWASIPMSSTIPLVDLPTLRRWLGDLPPPPRYRVAARPLRYRRRPHLAAFCEFDDRLITLQVPEPFKTWKEPVYYRASRRGKSGMRFRWYAEQVAFRTRRDVLRFLYCHEFYHWYLYEVLGRKAAAETACDRFALRHFRARHLRIDWRVELPGYDPAGARPVRHTA